MLKDIRKIGFIVDTLNEDNLGKYIVASANKMLDANVEPIVFYKAYGLTAEVPRFARFLQCQAWGFKGPVISTNLDSTRKLINCPSPTAKYFYIESLEWALMNNFLWSDLHSVYCHKDINLIVKSQEDYDIMKNYWKEPVGICNNLNCDELMRILWKK